MNLTHENIVVVGTIVVITSILLQVASSSGFIQDKDKQHVESPYKEPMSCTAQPSCQPDHQSAHGSDLFSSHTAAIAAHQIAKPPSMTLLLELDIIKRVVGDRGLCLPDLLLQDCLVVEKIQQDKRHSIQDLYKAVFQEWLRGSSASWRALIEILNKCELKVLADDIANVVSEDILDVEPLPYSHSLEVASFVEWLKVEYKRRSVFGSQQLPSYEDIQFVNLTFVSGTGDKYMSMNQFLHQVKTFEHEHKRMLITGDPGSGKTTLMRYLTKKWAEGKILQSCQILLLIYLGICKNEYKSLTDLIKDTEYNGLEHVEEVSKTIEGNHGEGACFLLDAYDEKLVKRDFLEKLINLNYLSLSLCIVTSRPSFANRLKSEVHVGIVGFTIEYVYHYVAQLSEEIQNPLRQLWKEHPGIKQACQSPLYLSLIVYIVASNPDHKLSTSTKTQLYLDVMDSLIAHYQDVHHKWNAGSLRECIIKKPDCSDNILCCAFNTLQRAAFDVIFSKRKKFEMEESSLHASIKRLSIVGIHPVSRNEVTYSFAHRTFAEFFAALHLTTKPQDERLFYITKYHSSSVVWQFYFGLLGKYYPKNVTTISTLLKRYVSFGDRHSKKSICFQYCNAQNPVILTPPILQAIHELGWTAQDYYTSCGILVNSSVFAAFYRISLSKIDFMNLLTNILEASIVHKLCYHDDHSIIAVEDWTQKLNKVHLDFIQRNINLESIDPVVLPKTTSVTTLGIESLSSPLVPRNLKLLQYLSRFCITTVHKSSYAYKVLRSLPSTTSVDTSVVFRDSSEFEGILSYFASLQTLGIVFNNCWSSTYQLLGALRKPSELHTLKLSSLHCKDLPVLHFLEGLAELKHLHIRHSNFTGCTDYLVYSLKQIEQLVTLEISNSLLECQTLVGVLPFLSRIEELYLLDIGLTDHDVSVISIALQNLTLLNTLGLSSMFMTDASVRTLVSAMNYHQNFHTFKLSYDYIGRNASDFLALALLTDLQFLSVHATEHFENVNEIIKILEYLTRLNSLYWTAVEYDTDVSDILSRASRNLTNLQHFGFGELGKRKSDLYYDILLYF